MEATELRIGNFLQRSDGSVVTVKRLIQNDNDILVNETPGLFTLGHTALPIPLTEDILIKCGFTKVPLDSNNPEEGYYYSLRLSDYKYFDISLLSGDKNGIFEVYLFPYDNIRFKYLHQIQNIYQSITGKELEVNL